MNPFYAGVRVGGAHYSNFQQNWVITGINLNKMMSLQACLQFNITPWFAVETGYTWLGKLS